MDSTTNTEKPLSVPFIGVSRHRLGADGVGVTTLAAFHGCALRCRHCLNPQCLGDPTRFKRYTPEELYEEVRIDNLYFLATGGGICFGGGEPLLRSEFLRQFRKLCGSAWRLTAETSLAVPREAVVVASEVIDDFIVDIKDWNPTIYKTYTGRSNRRAIANLKYLLKVHGTEHIVVRVPHIPHYNTPADVNSTLAALRHIGVSHIDQFHYIEKG